ncbi:MAG: polar amino acid transport system permease protein [Planctomycetota bacterium]|jgi:polar amino acid transport system permease protein
MRLFKPVPGLSPGQTETDLAVIKPFRYSAAGSSADLQFSRWLGSLPTHSIVWVALLILLWPIVAAAQSGFSTSDAFAALWRWLPFLVGQGFMLNVVVSFLTMLVGTIAGVMLGLGQISPIKSIRAPSWFLTQLFRNSPWLVILFIVMLALPFEIRIGDSIIPIPDWLKAVFGLALPIMANISEIVRGAVQSVPTGQWEAAESLGYNRQQTLWSIILPQCFKRMIPPWMNWYAILTMATPLISLLGVEEIVTLSRQAMEAEDNHPELLVPFFGFSLLIFFVYCYPIARLTLRMEKQFSVKG